MWSSDREVGRGPRAPGFARSARASTVSVFTELLHIYIYIYMYIHIYIYIYMYSI